MGILDHTLVVIYGDHTALRRYYPDKLAHVDSRWLGRERLVPLIVYAKGMEPMLITVRGGQVDVLPTVAPLLGVDPSEYAQSAMGRNLLATGQDFVVLGTTQFLGDPSRRDWAREGLEISELAIKGDYFRGGVP